MGGLFESKQKTTSQQSTQVPLNFSQLMDRTLSFANEGLDTPFQAYNAPRIADLSANEQAGISAAGSQAGMYQPLIDMAMTNNADMQARGGIPTAGDLNQFINPYVDYVLGNSLDRLQEQSDTNMTKIGSTAAMSGAFGGTRHGVLEGANLAELLKSARDLSASTYSDAYDKGMGNWFRSQDLRRGTISDALNIAGQGSAYNKSDINALMQTGLVGRTRDQSVLDFAFSEFMREQQDPFTKAGFASSILGSYPTNLFTRNSQSETTNTPSPFSQIAGIGMAAAGLMTGNPAALAGLGAGASSLGPAASAGASAGENALLTQAYKSAGYDPLTGKPIGRAKGGLIKGYKKGGKVESYEDNYRSKQGPQSILDEILSGSKRVPGVAKHSKDKGVVQTPYYKNRPNPNVDFNLEALGNWALENFPLLNEPIFTYSDDDPERRASKYLGKMDTKIAADRLNRLALEGTLERSTYGKDTLVDDLLTAAAQEQSSEDVQNAEWMREWAPKAHEELANITTRTDPLDDFLIPDGDFQRQYTKTLSSGPTGKKKKYAKGGEVKTNFFDGGMAALFGGVFGFGGDKPRAQAPMAPPATMVEAFNSPQYQTQGGYRQGTLFGGSILDAVLGRGAYSPNERQVRTGSTPAPYTPKPQTPYDWSSFYERQGLNRIPTAQSRINPNYASGARPDLSMFMQMLQERLGGQGGGGQLPTPPFQGYAKGGRVKRFDKGGIIEDITSLLDIAPGAKKRAWKKEMENDSDPLYLPLDAIARFMPTQEPYGGGNTLPISDLLDNERVFKLALQKHESGAKEYDNPNFKARPIDEKGNALSSAFGVGQWILPTWNTLAQKSKGEIPSWTQAKLDKGEFPDKATQEKAWSIWNNLLQNKYGNDYVARFAAHQLGDAGFDKLRRAGSNRLVKDVLGATVAKNVSASKETVGEYLNRLNTYVDSARNWEVDRLKQKGGVATDITRKGPMLMSATDKAFNAKYYPQDILEAIMTKGGVDAQPFQRKGDLTIEELQASPAGASASARTDEGNYQIEDYLPSNRDGRVSRPTSRQSKPKSFNSPLEVLIGNQKPEAYLDQRIEGIPAEAVLPDFTIGGRNAISQNDIERMLMESGLDPQPFKKKKYQGGGYVKKYAEGGGPLDAEDYFSNMGMEAVRQIDRDNKQARDILTGGWDNDSSIASNVLSTIPRGLASIVPTTNAAWKGMGLPVIGALDMLFGSGSKQPDSKSLLEGFNELRKPPKPWTDVSILPFTPDNQGTSPEDFNSALENGEPSDIVSKPAQEQLQEDSLTTALKAMIMQEIEDRKGRKEPSPPTLFGREINMPLLKMGLGILANSGYPNSAGEAIGKGVLGALNEEEQAQLDKSKRNNDKLKELLNLRYMQGMVESMDPNIKMQLQREKAMQDLKERQLALETEYQLRYGLSEAQRPGRLEDAKALKEFESNLGMQGAFGNITPPEPEV